MPFPPSPPRCLAVAALLLAGCGGAEPTLDTAVVEELAQRADGIADALAGGRDCLALERIAGLEAATASAREAGEVPDTVAAEVLTTAQRLEQDTACEPEPSPSPTGQDGADDEGDDDGGDDESDRGGDGGAGPGGDDDGGDDDHPGNRGQGNGPGNGQGNGRGGGDD